MNKPDKGEYKGSCNRKDCQKPGAVWFNHSTKKYYCASCARLINELNKAEAFKLFGHNLCIKHD